MDKYRKFLIPYVTRILKHPCYHVFIPQLIRLIGNRLFFQHRGQLGIGVSQHISVEYAAYKVRFRLTNRNRSGFHVISEGKFAIAHYLTVLSIVSASSRPLNSLNRSCSLFFTTICSTSSPNNSSSKVSGKSGPLSNISISSLVWLIVLSPSAFKRRSFFCFAARSCSANPLDCDIKKSGAMRPYRFSSVSI